MTPIFFFFLKNFWRSTDWAIPARLSDPKFIQIKMNLPSFNLNHSKASKLMKGEKMLQYSWHFTWISTCPSGKVSWRSKCSGAKSTRHGECQDIHYYTHEIMKNISRVTHNSHWTESENRSLFQPLLNMWRFKWIYLERFRFCVHFPECLSVFIWSAVPQQ